MNVGFMKETLKIDLFEKFIHRKLSVEEMKILSHALRNDQELKNELLMYQEAHTIMDDEEAMGLWYEIHDLLSRHAEKK